jgi:hypothetical protein
MDQEVYLFFLAAMAIYSSEILQSGLHLSQLPEYRQGLFPGRSFNSFTGKSLLTL